jgi:hypothetical protein
LNSNHCTTKPKKKKEIKKEKQKKKIENN